MTNVKAFKQLRAAKKVPDDDKLPTLQGLSLPLDAPNDTSPDSSVTIVPETVEVLPEDRADVPDEEDNDTRAIVDRNVASDTLPVVDTLPTSINASTGVVTNLITPPAQITAINVLIAETNDLQQLRDIRFSLTETLASLDSKLDTLAQKN